MDNELIFELEKEEYFEKDIEIIKIFNNKPCFAEIESTFSPLEENTKIISKGWQLRKDELINQNKKIYNSKLLRFEKIEENTISFSDKIEYKDVVGLRYWRYETFRDWDKSTTPNALSLFNILITKDDKLIISKRNCGDWEQSYEICGGFIRANEKNILEASLNRIRDDYNLQGQHIYNQEIKAIYHYKKISETTMMIIVKLDISMDEFFNLSSNKDLIFIDNNQSSVFELLKNNTEIILPSYYVLMLYLKQEFQKIEVID